MNRYKILKGEDPCSDSPDGDPFKFILANARYKGWVVSPTEIILEVPKNVGLFLLTCAKDRYVEIKKNDGKNGMFKIDSIYKTDYKARDNFVKIKAEGFIEFVDHERSI